MEHLKKKIETYKSNIGAKRYNTSWKGQRDPGGKRFLFMKCFSNFDESV